MLALLRELSESEGQTLVMVTHDPAAAAIADRVVFLRDGRVAGEIAGGSAERIAEEFTRLFAAKIADLTVGDPMAEDTQVGPLATESGLEDVEKYVQDAVGKGARVLAGGKRVDRPGWFYEPTVLTGITPDMRIHREETFGPVATLYRVADLEEAVELANDTPFGLSSNVWTRDEGEMDRCVRDLEAGGVFFNGMTASHPALPFGGVKRSGYGRELAGHGIREFCNATTVWYGPESDAR